MMQRLRNLVSCIWQKEKYCINIAIYFLIAVFVYVLAEGLYTEDPPQVSACML